MRKKYSYTGHSSSPQGAYNREGKIMDYVIISQYKAKRKERHESDRILTDKKNHSNFARL